MDLRQIVAAVSAALTHPALEELPGIFERQVQQLLSMRAVRLREIPARYQARLVTPTRTPESIVVSVPTADPSTQAVLEASFDRGRTLDERDFELLTAAAQLGGLVLEATRRWGPPRLPLPAETSPLVGSSSAMVALREQVARVAQTDFTVLIEGESGTGKELVARQIHESSRRRKGPFVAVNCAAVVETLLEAELFGIEERTATGVRGRRGKFEYADGGTLFLDEVSDLAVSAQAKLLRAIQDLAVERVGTTGTRRVNTRIVAATNRPLAGLAANGLFRSDLFYRVSGVDIHVPPLRDRREDIPELAEHFLERHRATRRLTLSDGALDALRLYDWPGNVRELERLVERAVALAAGCRIELDDLPPQVRGDYRDVLAPSIAAGDSMRAWASRYARLVFERCGRNKRIAARHLEISYHTLDAYLRFTDGPRPLNRRLPRWAKTETALPSAPRPADGEPRDS
ncbi:MAG: sigma-54-dependent Fis family transcriptional regulator [Acidobacteria bacterium]|nr:sigma-54-dependent Fis family transcriptional regulator [Acidobacteriota bacterium]